MSDRPAVRWWAPLTAAILLGSALRFWRLGDLALIGDESYYWLWSEHLDWAYFDHPAGVAVLTWLSTVLGGPSEVGIRWLNALVGVLCILGTYLLGARLLSRQAALFAALIVAAGAPYLLTSRFVYTDALQLLLLLLNMYWFWRVIQKSAPHLRTSIAWGVSLALLFNTKYNAYLYALALVVAILIDHRHLLREKRFWLGGLIAAIGLLPVLLWNASHGWVSIRWQLQHASTSLTGDYGLLGSLYHALSYLTWPLVALALLGIGRLRRPAERLLTLVALFLLVPVLLSPANSPRNLSSGLVLLLLLAGTRWPDPRVGRRKIWMAGLLVGTVATAFYGVGTVASLSNGLAWPRSNAVPDIRRDAAGWRDLGPALVTDPRLVFALDYSIASQIWYYSGRPAYTAWGQYRIWGIPPFDDATIASLDYLPQEQVTSQLRGAFEAVQGPQRILYQEADLVKEVRLWLAEGLQLDQEDFLAQFDFLTLLEASR